MLRANQYCMLRTVTNGAAVSQFESGIPPAAAQDQSFQQDTFVFRLFGFCITNILSILYY